MTTTFGQKPIALFWHRRDLRFSDNAGLYQALTDFKNVQPVFIFDAEILDDLENKSDRRVSFIYEAVSNLKKTLHQFGSDLWIFHGKPLDIFIDLSKRYHIAAIYANADYEPYATQRDQGVEAFCRQKGIRFKLVKDQVIFEKNEVVKPDGLPYTVFTPYSRKWLERLQTAPIVEFDTFRVHHNLNKGVAWPMLKLESMGFKPIPHLIAEPNVSDAMLMNYKINRNMMGERGTTKISAHLRFGTVSIRKLVKQAQPYPDYLNELIWREFYMQWLWHFPLVVFQSFKPAYDNIKWNTNDADFERWCSAKTGYPIVDAAMNELLQTGYMHNRARMITASFLTKHLLVDWRKGEAFFARHLTDFELSSNVGGWQWASGSGCDAAPYFRIFNPTLQTQKFDPDGKYIKQWSGNNGSSPMVDHTFARNRCLEAYKMALNP